VGKQNSFLFPWSNSTGLAFFNPFNSVETVHVGAFISPPCCVVFALARFFYDGPRSAFWTLHFAQLAMANRVSPIVMIATMNTTRESSERSGWHAQSWPLAS
jgi:hypothetical protein